ncbi:MAG: peptidoglycan D,D-transpeptidase FtsI family protein [Actinomycetota bacterium]
MTRPPISRLVALFVGLVVGFGIIGVRLAVLQVSQAEALQARAMSQRMRTIDLPAQRGEILDRNREPLAISVEARDIYADPRHVLDPAGTAAVLSEMLGVDRADLERRLASTTSSFTYVARQVDLKLARRVEAEEFPGVGFLPTSKRAYPAGALAPQVLGFVGVDGVGLSGLEYAWDSELGGTAGERTLELSPGGLPILGGVDAGSDPVPGSTLVLTLDRDFQYRVQAALERAVAANGAEGGMVVVMDPRTGDVLAMATYPWFDPNAFASADPVTFRNRPATDAFEPGSTAKIVTAAAAVELGAVRLDERFVVPDEMEVDEYTIHDAHPHRTLDMTVGDIFAESSNVGMAQIAQRLGPETLSSYLDRFGFGARTGIGFPAESAGIMLPLEQWSDSALATIAYGQGIGASLLQMTSVYATIANGGVRVAPRLVEGTVGPAGAFHRAPRTDAVRVVSADTASTLTSMLVYAVESGTGLNARIPAYQVAGKTGTARIPLPDRAGYYENQYVASFIGFLPASDPQLVIATVLDRPTTAYGGIAAAPLFREIAEYGIARLGITPAAPIGLPPRLLPAP